MFGQIFPGGGVTQCVMWPLLVVFLYPVFRQFAKLIKRSEHIHIQDLVAVSAVKSLHIGVLSGRTRLNELKLDTVLFCLFG